MHDERIYQLALTQVPQIGTVGAKMLMRHFDKASDIFRAKKSQLAAIDNIGELRAAQIKNFNNFRGCETELELLEKENIKTLFLNDPAYPKRLLNCYDSPTILFTKGEADLNASRMAAIIGTRSCTEYGRNLCDELCRELATQKISVVSGLAFGIDTLAHRNALKYDTPTLAVLGNGFSTLYPSENRGLARQMLENGGALVTECFFYDKPDRHQFPNRNRIVAGMCDVTIVVETDVKGGSMITAELANGYNRDVLAFPGRTTDARSRGCNELIRKNKAALATSGQQVLEFMNWLPTKKPEKIQRKLFVQLTPEEEKLVALLGQQPALHIDEINLGLPMSASAIASALLSLELQGIVQSQPGKRYSLL